MKVLLESVERLQHLVSGWRHERRLLQRAPCGTDPVLRAPKLTRSLAFSPDARHQALMDFPNEPKRHGQGGEPDKPVLQRLDIIGHLAYVGDFLLPQPCRLEEQQVGERGLSSLNSARENGLTANEGSDQEVRIRQGSCDAGQLAERAVSLGKLLDQRQGEFDLGSSGFGM